MRVLPTLRFGLGVLLVVSTRIAAEEAPSILRGVIPGTSTMVVVAEGQLEPRSIGSYSARIYSGRNRRFPYDDFVAGTVRRRDGALEKLLFSDLDGDALPEIVVVLRSAGTGGHLSADAFQLRGSTLALVGSVAGLAKDADPIRALRQKMATASLGGAAIVGAFRAELGNAADSVEIQLECESESSCVLTTTARSAGESPTIERKALKNVRPVENLTDASNALEYAIEQKSAEIRNEEYLRIMTRLRPVLESHPRIGKCWDLNYTSPDYMLVCTLANAPAGSPPIYLFGTLLANCGEAFCRFVIYPLSKAR
jgi:hypothetical protein